MMDRSVPASGRKKSLPPQRIGPMFCQMCLEKNGEGKAYNGMAICLSHGVLIAGTAGSSGTAQPRWIVLISVMSTAPSLLPNQRLLLLGWIARSEDTYAESSGKKQNERASLSAATQDYSLSDDGSVPMFQNSDDDGSDCGSADDSDCSVDEGIATEVVGERVVDTGIWEESLSQVNAAVTSRSAKRKRTSTHVSSLAIKELPIPRKIVKTIPPSLIIA